MDTLRLGAVLRALRIRRRLRQEDVGRAAGVSRGIVSRAERGDVEGMTVGALDRVARALEVRVDLIPRWRGGELDRLVNADHAALLETTARMFEHLSGWSAIPEVTFSIYGERGSIDLLAWHPATRSLLVIELKTAIVDVHDLLATLDRKRRLAWQVARDRGWDPASVSTWVAVSDTTTNRRRVAAHSAALRGVLPIRGTEVRRWLRRPLGSMGALSFLSHARLESTRRNRRGVHRVRRPAHAARPAAREPSAREPGTPAAASAQGASI